MKSTQHPKIEFFEDNRDNHGDIIIILKSGWCFDKQGEHLGTYYDCDEAREAIRLVKPCTCPECLAKEETKMNNSELKKVKRINMVDSIKLDRTITCLEVGESWKNAHQMWIAHVDWMTSSQQDRLTAQLYAAAKLGEQKRVVINDRTFMLVNMPKVK